VARAGENEDARLVVGLEAIERLAQLARRVAVDGVAPLAPVDRDQSGGATPLVGD
jgi:hypothetical protein